MSLDLYKSKYNFKMAKRKFINNIFKDNNGEEFSIMKNESNYKRSLYRKVINKCCMPSCEFGYNLQVHHIIPINKGGNDNFDNFIVLCSDCHRKSNIHRYSDDNRLQLYVFKFYNEQDILGFTCDPDEISDEFFWVKIREIIYNEDKGIIKSKKKSKKSTRCNICNCRIIKLNPWTKYCKLCLNKMRLRKIEETRQ